MPRFCRGAELVIGIIKQLLRVKLYQLMVNRLNITYHLMCEMLDCSYLRSATILIYWDYLLTNRISLTGSG